MMILGGNTQRSLMDALRGVINHKTSAVMTGRRCMNGGGAALVSPQIDWTHILLHNTDHPLLPFSSYSLIDRLSLSDTENRCDRHPNAPYTHTHTRMCVCACWRLTKRTENDATSTDMQDLFTPKQRSCYFSSFPRFGMMQPYCAAFKCTCLSAHVNT